jgi:hypothetical protein
LVACVVAVLAFAVAVVAELAALVADVAALVTLASIFAKEVPTPATCAAVARPLSLSI